MIPHHGTFVLVLIHVLIRSSVHSASLEKDEKRERIHPASSTSSTSQMSRTGVEPTSASASSNMLNDEEAALTVLSSHRNESGNVASNKKQLKTDILNSDRQAKLSSSESVSPPRRGSSDLHVDHTSTNHRGLHTKPNVSDQGSTAKFNPKKPQQGMIPVNNFSQGKS